ncbi:hypothetical protein J421_1007 [Gemmatirosa kalamazoonensis]|uniref:DUF4352 domain-containing protein n=1 Tax=Gemmatirosa kalamazoonensis TaxID=861299 RepID=W0RBR1_9BACT|nr:hypothetical protein [Gemmatirosa kalamazoonensis]AHG88544.1 hypothetical protein J421_1007 [Gemmatirosa kalamazoonensis]
MTLPLQLQAQLQVLTFLGTVALVGIGMLAAVAFALVDRRRHVALAAGGTVAVIGAYAAALVALGAAGRDRVLGPGEPKVFCEVDCHLAYTVTRVRVTPTAAGDRYTVTVRTHFDEHSVAPWRGDDPIYPNARRVRVVDAAGHAWNPGTRGGTALSAPLRPGESHESTFTFDLPAGVTAPRLELTEAAAITRLLVGHENSPLHGKTVMALGRGFAAGG